MAETNSFLDTGIISVDPLVTFTKRHTPTPLGLVNAWPELFRGRPSLNFVGATWSLYPKNIPEVVEEIRGAASQAPDARIVYLANTDAEACKLSAAGIPVIVANETIFVNERIFIPLPEFDFSDARYDAIYNARFARYKRHELACKVHNLALIYDRPFDGTSPPSQTDVGRALPQARALNHEHGHGRYVSLSGRAIAREVNFASCGLCLSADEGAMRASMEYLMCGIPVVSTESRGGRDRYYQPPYAIIVPDKAEAVRDAITELRRRKLNKLKIREHIERIVGFERRNFLKIANALGREHLGIDRLFDSVEAFTRSNPFVAPDEDWSRQKLARVAEALEVALPPRAGALNRMEVPAA